MSLEKEFLFGSENDPDVRAALDEEEFKKWWEKSGLWDEVDEDLAFEIFVAGIDVGVNYLY